MDSHEFVVKAGSILTLLLTGILVAEKVFEHEPKADSLWQDIKNRKARYDAQVMADAIVMCYGPQLDDAAIERSLDAFRREISAEEHKRKSS